jgi:hypothetical protein
MAAEIFSDLNKILRILQKLAQNFLLYLVSFKFISYVYCYVNFLKFPGELLFELVSH